MGNNLTEQMDMEPAQDMDPLAIDSDTIKFNEVYIKTEMFPSEDDDPSYCGEPQHILPVSADIQLKEEDISEDDESSSMYPDSVDAFEPFSIVGGKQQYSKGMCSSCSSLNRYSTPPNETPLEREQRIRRKYHTFHRILKLPDELRDQKWACRCPPELGSSAIRKQLSRCVEDHKHFRSYISRYDTPPRESNHERNRRIARKNQAIYMYRQKMRSNGIVYTMKSKNDKSSNSSARAHDREEYLSNDSVTLAPTLNKKNNSIAQMSSKMRWKSMHPSERWLLSGYETPPDETKEERKRRLDRRNQAICRYRRKLKLTGKMQTKKSNNDKTCTFKKSALASDDEEDMGNNSETSNSDEEDSKYTHLSEPPLPSGYETPPEETKEERRRRLARKNQAMYLYRKKLKLFGKLQAKKLENDKSCAIANSEVASNVEEDLTNYSETLKTEQQINNIIIQLPSKECAKKTHLVKPPLLSGYETPPEETKKERRRRLVRKNQAIYWYRKKLRLIANNVHTTQSKNDKSSTSNNTHPSLRPLISGYETPPEETKEERKRRLARKHQAIYLYRKKLKLTRNASNHPHLSVRPQLSGYETPPDETKEERKRRLARKHQAIYLFRKKFRLTGKVQTKRSKNDKTCTSNNATLAADDYLAKNSKASKSSLLIKINSIAQLSSKKRSKNTQRSERPLISGYETPPNETKEERKRRLDRRNQAICRYRKKLRLTGNVLTIKSEKEETCTSNNSEMAASDNGEEEDLAVDSEASKSVLMKFSSYADSSDEENSSKTNIFEPPLVSGYETPPEESKEERRRRLARKSQAICRYRKKLRLTGILPTKISENDKSCTSYNSEFAASDDEEDLANDFGASNSKLEENNSNTEVPSEKYSKKKYLFEPLLLSGYETPPEESKEERRRRLARKSQAICRYRKKLRLTGNFPEKISVNDKSCTSYNSEFAASDEEEDLAVDSEASKSVLMKISSYADSSDEENSSKTNIFEPPLISGYETPPEESKEERRRRLARKSQGICRYRKKLRQSGNLPAKISENDKSCTSYNSEFAASDDEEDLVSDFGASNSKLEENNSITQVPSNEYSNKTNHFEPPLVSGYETPPEETKDERRRRLARKSQAICRYRKKLKLTGNVNTTKSENDKNFASNNSEFDASDDDAEDLAVHSKSDDEYSNNARLFEPALVSGYETPPEESKEERRRRLARKSQAMCRYRKKLRLTGILPTKISENHKSCTTYNSEFAPDDEEELANDSEASKSDEECSKNANLSDQLLVSGYEIPPDAMKEELKQLRLTGSAQEKKLENENTYSYNNFQLASDGEEDLANESEVSKEHEEDSKNAHPSEPPLPSGYETPPEETKEERRRRLARKYQAMYLYRKKLRLTSKSENDKTSTSNNAHLSVRPHICGYETPPDETKEERKRRIARRNQAIYRYRQMLKHTGNVHTTTSEDDKTSTSNNTHSSETRRNKSESEY